MPLAQTLLMVVAGTLCGSPPATAACVAGAWPTLAEQTLPNRTSWIAAGSTPARATAAVLVHVLMFVCVCVLPLLCACAWRGWV